MKKEKLQFKIREATLRDLKIIQELNRKLCTKEFEEFDDTINPDYPMTKKGKDYFKERIEDKKNSFAYVVEDDSFVVGYFFGGINEIEDYRFDKKLAEGETTFIEKEYRGKGIGSQFIKMFEEWARKKRAKRLRFVASFRNRKAIKLYKRFALEIYDVVLEKNIE